MLAQLKETALASAGTGDGNSNNRCSTDDRSSNSRYGTAEGNSNCRCGIDDGNNNIRCGTADGKNNCRSRTDDGNRLWAPKDSSRRLVIVQKD